MNKKKINLKDINDTKKGGKPLNESYTPPPPIRTTKPKKEETKGRKK
jgi:hypothetical protein